MTDKELKMWVKLFDYGLGGPNPFADNSDEADLMAEIIEDEREPGRSC